MIKLLGDLPNTHWLPTGEDLVQNICDLHDRGTPPTNERVKESNLDEFDVGHCPIYLNVRKQCVVCFRKGRGCKFVFSSCGAPQCQGLHMHITKELNSYRVYHTRQFYNMSVNGPHGSL